MVPGHVKSMMDLSLVRCKMLKIPSPVINDKLIPILSFFFADVQKVLKKLAPPYTVGDKLSIKVRELERAVGILLAKCKPSSAQNVSRESRRKSVSRVLRIKRTIGELHGKLRHEHGDEK